MKKCILGISSTLVIFMLAFYLFDVSSLYGTASDVPLQDMKLPAKSNVTRPTYVISYIAQRDVETEEIEDISCSDLACEISQLVQNSSNTAILIDGFDILVYNDMIRILFDELETTLTSTNSATVYLCSKNDYFEVVSYNELLASNLEPTSGNFLEVIAQLQKEEDFDRYIIISIESFNFFYPASFDESYFKILFNGLFSEGTNKPKINLYTPSDVKTDALIKYLSEKISSLKQEQDVDVIHRFILPLDESDS